MYPTPPPTGFCTWPTTAKLPDGSPYGYAVAQGKGDVVGQYVAAMKEAGIGHGFYYSLDANYYLQHSGNVSITPAEFQAIEIHQLTELWSAYGELTEIWLDGGFSAAIKDALAKTFKTYQPKVVAMNGGGAATNPARWIGTEGDMGDAVGFRDVWSTYCCNGTDGNGTKQAWPFPCVTAHTATCSLNSAPNYGGAGCAPTGVAPQDTPEECSTWQGAGLDYTLQQADVWFHTTPATPLRPLSEMITTYHNSVGRNTVMELDFAIARTGKLDPSHSLLYAALGGWIKTCYGSPLANTSYAPPPVQGPGRGYLSYSVTIEVPAGQQADRLMFKEDQSHGQRILSFEVPKLM